jgi:hypothetical protein
MSQISIVYFTGINPRKDYKCIIGGQLDDIISSQVLSVATLYLQISCVFHELVDEIRELIETKLTNFNFHLEFHNKNLCDYHGIKKLYDLAKEDPSKIYCYLHGKAMFNYENYKRHAYELLLTNGTISRWRDVLNLFETNHENKISIACMFPSGTNIAWYNFYWVRGSYLTKCEVPVITSNRFCYEIWLGTGDTTPLTYNLIENNHTKYCAGLDADSVLKKLSNQLVSVMNV